MSFITSIMEAKLAAATDPDEIAARKKVLADHIAGQKIVARWRAEAEEKDDG